MKKHRLLIYDVLSRRFSWKLLVLWLVLAGVGLVDLLYRPILGDYWYILWLAVLLVVIMWVYYSFLLPRAWVVVKPDCLILQTPEGDIEIEYGRIDTITSSQLAQHYTLKSLPRRDRVLAKPYLKRTSTLVEMNSLPSTLKKKQNQLPRILFSTRRPGILLLVEDWIQLSRDIEMARTKWQNKLKAERDSDDDDRGRSLAARILDY